MNLIVPYSPRYFNLEFHFVALLDRMLEACTVVHDLKERADVDVRPILFSKPNDTF